MLYVKNKLFYNDIYMYNYLLQKYDIIKKYDTICVFRYTTPSVKITISISYLVPMCLFIFKKATNYYFAKRLFYK